MQYAVTLAREFFLFQILYFLFVSWHLAYFLEFSYLSWNSPALQILYSSFPIKYFKYVYYI